jgi:hypothetical protein
MNKSEMDNQADFKGTGWYAPVQTSFLGKSWTAWVYLPEIEKDDTSTAAATAFGRYLGTPIWFEDVP